MNNAKNKGTELENKEQPPISPSSDPLNSSNDFKPSIEPDEQFVSPIQTVISPTNPVATPATAETPTQSPNLSQTTTPAPAAPIVSSTQPTSFNGGAIESNNPTLQFNQKQKHRKKGLLIGIVVAGFFLVSSSAAGYVGVILPNKPENVWESTMSNMGQAYDEVTEFGLTIESAKGLDVDGAFSYKYDQDTLSGDYKVKSYDTDLMSEINVKQDNFSAKFEIMTATPEGQSTPNLYAKVAELKNLSELADPEVADQYNQFVGKWYVFDFGALTEEPEQQYTTEDYKQVVDAIGASAKEYLFSVEEGKAVLVVDEFVGKEDQFDNDTYHYKVSIDQAALKEFEKSLNDSVRATKIGESIGSDEEIQDYTGGLTEELDQLGSFDIWINKSTKLIQTIRAYEENSTDSYSEFGQLFEGGDKIPLFVNYQDKADSGDNLFNLKLDLDKNQKTAVLDAKYTEASGNNNFELKSNFRTNSDELNLTAPTDAISIWELFYGGSYTPPQIDADTLGWNIGIEDINQLDITNYIDDLQTLIEQLQLIPNSPAFNL